MTLNKQQALERIEADLGHAPELLGACRAVVRFLADHKADDLRQITFGMLGRAAGIPPIETIPVAQYLTSPRARLLEKCFMLIIDGDEFEVTHDEVAEARRNHVLYHPDRGEPIPDFEEALYVYFTLSSDGRQLTETH